MDKQNVLMVNAVYLTFQGEQNPLGIGAPAIFVRFAGCHIRCYLGTMGILCDTPEALSKDSGRPVTPQDLVEEITELSENTGVYSVCLTGGDPLWRDPSLLELFLYGLSDKVTINIETSGTLDWSRFIKSNVHFVLDWKLSSAGIAKSKNLVAKPAYYKLLTNKDFIKFVVADDKDYTEAVSAINELFGNTKATLTVGVFWGGEITTFELFEKLKTDGLLGKVTINMQAHKMAIASNYGAELPQKI